MVQKRQLTEEEYDVSPKHLKLEHSHDLVPFLQFTKENAPLPTSTIENDDYTLPRRLSTSSFSSSTTSEEEDLKSLTNNADAYSYLFKLPPLKNVPIGPQYQADIPECHAYNDNDNKFMGFSVISMPDESPTIQEHNTVGKGRRDCHCKDFDSQKCIPQHINEARETLKGKTGNEKFEKLGFGNMGESVAKKWSEKDQQLFHEVVYSNPVSFGQNFWNILAKVFPSKSNQEIVSYYFNVFMLRKRAEQNRCDSMNVDSDDDEWQGSDGSEESECDSDGCRNGIVDSVMEGNHEFVFEHSDSKVWDFGYFSCPKSRNDFLPFEEVFGVESWNFEVVDDDKRLK